MVDLPDVLDLTAPQTRVLGCLLEKSLTTPDAYPLTLKALTTACNQSSSRDPVVDYEAQLVETTALALKAKGLVRVVHPSGGERATKYRHVVDEALGLDAAARAVIAVLCLRGAQSANELASRTERLHAFATANQVEAVLEGLASAERTLVQKVPRQTGQRDDRWIQLLEANAAARAAVAPSASSSAAPRSAGRVDELESRVSALESRVAELVSQLGDLVELSHEPTEGAGEVGDN